MIDSIIIMKIEKLHYFSGSQLYICCDCLLMARLKAKIEVMDLSELILAFDVSE